jgi:hypothetical protein
MDADMDTFVTALYVKIDDELTIDPSLRIARPAVITAKEHADRPKDHDALPELSLKAPSDLR